MKSLSPTETGALILAGALLIAGVFIVLNPKEGVFLRPTERAKGVSFNAEWEQVSKKGSRIYGALSILSGLGLAVFILFPRK